MPDVDDMSFIDRCVKVLTSPYEFFKTKFTPDLGTPATHVMLVAVIVALIGLIINAPIQLMSGVDIMLILGGGLIGLILAPFITLLTWFVGGLINHLFVLLVGGKGGWKRTLKVLAYVSTVNFITAIPIIGIIISFFYGLYLTYVGYKKQHKLSGIKAAAAVLLPIIVIMVILVLIALVMGAAMFALIAAIAGGAQSPTGTI